MKAIQTKILHSDCKDKLKEVKSNYIDLIVTSPPFPSKH